MTNLDDESILQYDNITDAQYVYFCDKLDRGFAFDQGVLKDMLRSTTGNTQIAQHRTADHDMKPITAHKQLQEQSCMSINNVYSGTHSQQYMCKKAFGPMKINAGVSRFHNNETIFTKRVAKTRFPSS